MNTILLIVGIGLGAAFLVPLAGRRGRPLADLIACAATLALLCLSFKAVLIVRAAGVVVYKVGGWPPPFGIALALDGLSVFMLVTINLIAFLVTLYAVDYMDRYTGRWKFYTLFLLMVAGMNGVAVTGDLFNLFVFLEIATLASYALVAFGTESEELEAGFKYMVMGSLASSFILLGIALLYSFASTLNMADMAMVLESRRGSPLLLFSGGLFIAGFGLKAAIVPFHAWLPDAHPSAPAPISAMLSGVFIKVLGVYAVMRIFYSVLGITPEFSLLFMVLGSISMITGACLAIGQTDMKRMLAYSSISQVGYIFLGLGIGTPLAVTGALLHLVNHAVFKSLLFLNSGAVEYATGTRDLREMGGLGRKLPVTGCTSLIGSLSIAGLPPMGGFWSKLLIIMAAVAAGHLVAGFIAAAVSVLTIAYYAKLQKEAFFGALDPKWSHVREVPGSMRISMIALAIVCIVLGVLLIPHLTGGLLSNASESILLGTGYARRMIGAIR